MDTSGSAGNDQDRNNNSRKILRWSRRRYRDRIWCLYPETWLALGFLLLVMGLSLLNTGYFFTSDADREQVFKFGVFVLCSGWATLIFLVERVKSRNWCSSLHIRSPHPAFIGVSIGPPIQPEFLSAMLLPEIDREWVPVETLPGFEPRHAEIIRPSWQQATTGEDNGEESRSKKRRNRKKKVNNSFSELDSASQESNETTILQFAPIDANQEDRQSRDLNVVGLLPSMVITQESEREFNIPKQASEQKALQESQPTESNPDDDNLNKLNCQEKDQRHRSQGTNHQPSLRLNEIISNDNSSSLDKVVEEYPASDHPHEDSQKTANGLKSEVSFLESVKTSMNLIAGDEDQQKKLELALSSPGQNYMDDSSEQLNKIPSHWTTMTMLEREKPVDQTLSTNTTSSEVDLVISKPVSPDFITFTSKKRNRRRKK